MFSLHPKVTITLFVNTKGKAIIMLPELICAFPKTNVNRLLKSDC